MKQRLKSHEELQRLLDIEAALECVRARAMAMESSEELSDVLSVLFQQFDLLGISPKTAWLTLWNPEENTFTYRSTGTSGLRIQGQQVLEIDGMDIWRDLYEKWKNDTSASVEVLFYAKEDLAKLFSLLQETYSAMPPEERLNPEHFPNGGYSVQGHCKFGYIGYTHTLEPTEEDKAILTRFATEFGRVYQRFLDIKKAEAQAREAQIEAALERVRARTMAMHKTDELQDVINTVYQQFLDLKVAITGGAFIAINSEIDSEIVCWGAGGTADYIQKVHLPFMAMPMYTDLVSGIKKGPGFFQESFTHSEKQQFFKLLFRNPPYSEASHERKEEILSRPGGYTRSCMVSEHTSIFIINHHGRPFSEGENNILKRMGTVFEQTYTRFLDLQKAEAQAREAQIEAALERVRAATMAMHSSSELSEVAAVLFRQMHELGVTPERVNIGIVQEQEGFIEYWSTEQGGRQIDRLFRGSIDEPTTLSKLYAGWKAGQPVLELHQSGKELAQWIGHLTEVLGIPFDERFRQERRVQTAAYFKHGMLLISTPEAVSEESLDLLSRFGKVFEQTYTRFLDLQRAEAQAREAEIQLALERIRARSMAMQSSEELREVVQVMYEQVEKLGIAKWGCMLLLFDRPNQKIQGWFSDVIHSQYPWPFEFTDRDHEIIKKWWGFWESNAENLSIHLKDDEKHDFDRYLFSQTGMQDLPEDFKEFVLREPEVWFEYTNLDCGLIEFIDHEPFPESSIPVLNRISQAFEQAYTRFLDLQRAESQAREAQIEAALERVRASTMAMHQSEELNEVLKTMFQELIHLDFKLARCVIWIYNEEDRTVRWYAANPEAEIKSYLIPYSDYIVMKDYWDFWEKRIPRLYYDLSGNLKKGMDEYVFKHTEMSRMPEAVKQGMMAPEQVHLYNTFQDFGSLFVSSEELLGEEILDILERFGKAFNQSYTRFLDLQRAEAQAREAQIEAALERVRARTMAMHNTDDIADTVVTFFEELVGLGLDDTMRAGIGILSQSENMKVWTASVPGTGKTILHSGFLDMSRHPLLQGVKRTWSNGDPYFTYVLKGEDLKAYFHNLNEAPEYPAEFDLNKLPETVNHRSIPFRDGVFFAFTESPLPQDIIHTLERFAAVFGQTYTRYLDLERAEKQARESQIEAALERVRAKALAMHSSADLRQTITTLFEELKNLDVKPLRLGLGLLNPDKPEGEIVTSRIGENNEIIEVSGAFELVGDPILERVYDHFKKQLDYFPILEGDEITSYYAALTKSVDVEGYGTDTKHYGCFLFFPEGGLYAWAAEPHSEAQIEILKKFSRVVEITYRRYNDLIESEAREKEAVKQASLDRVRAEIASMRTTQDLERITPLVWQELTTLGIPFFRCGVFIMDEVSQLVHVYLTNPSGEALAAMDLPFDFDMSLIQKGVVHWRKQESLIEEWDQHQFIEMTKKLMEHGQVKNIQTYQAGEKPPERLVLHQVPFAQGMLYVGSTQALSDEEMDIVKALTRTFAVAYARYEDFRELEKAKQKVEKTLDELKATQAQLIHSEKMASLGELTAGIAHEIQNPLNFVNNFSEVSRELLEEMTEEIEKGDWAEVKALAGDVIRNLEKITHHGQRADSIVKGMLQHSRSSDGNKEPTDLNALADEYLRLAYHGLRARDKGFNASMVTEFDQDLPGVEVVPQDIGRVLLNLLTNAFHAVSERKKGAPEGFEPTVTVRTRKTGKGVEIQVADNGNGIPKSIREKIFQPFFTTKPTGQGTGLGLSLSYDIVKAHGGELSLTTKEGKGSTFFITFKQNS